MGHDGWNEGFLTNWKFSLKKDICIAMMYNNATVPAYNALEDTAAKILSCAKE